MHKRIIIFLLSFVYFAYCNNGSYPVYYNHKVKQTKQKERGNNYEKDCNRVYVRTDCYYGTADLCSMFSGK